MKLILDIGDAEDGTFGPEDKVRGTLNILGHAGHKISRLRVTFGGRVTLFMSAQIAGPNPDDLEFTLFEENKELQYNDATSNKHDPANGVYIAPFSFQFPFQARCLIHAHSSHLPPSMDIREAKSRIKVEYYVVGTVDRQILGPFSKTTRAIKRLKFSNNVPLNILPVVFPNVDLPLELRQKDGSGHVEDGFDSLPAYKPCLRVETLIPQPSFLYRGQANPIKFILHTPSEVLGKIFVRTAEINFKTSTVTVVGLISRGVDEHCSGARMSGAIPVDSEMLVFDSGDWGGLFKLNLKPTFESCVMKIKHSVEIRVGISIGREGKIHYTSSWLDVQVIDPPPAYDDTE